MKTYSIRVDKDMAERISQYAKLDDRSDSAVIRKALKEFFFNENGATKKAQIVPANIDTKKSANCIADDVAKKGA